MQIPEELVDRLRSAEHVVAFTGAGMSAESGVPTFRDAQTGLWSNFRPEDLATPEAFLRNPRMVWEWYSFRRTAIGKTLPNPGHNALVSLQSQKKVTVITQNIDNLHVRAGQRIVYELHGNIERVKCFDENTVVAQWNSDEAPPVCPRCGGFLRPDVVWFGELLPFEAFRLSEEACRSCDILFSIGTSGVVYPAAGLPHVARQSGAFIVEINPDETPLTHVADVSLRGPSGRFLPLIVERLS